jgi:hypothetical protein
MTTSAAILFSFRLVNDQFQDDRRMAVVSVKRPAADDGLIMGRIYCA